MVAAPRPEAPRLPDLHQTVPGVPGVPENTHRLLEDVVRRQGRAVGWGGQVAQDGGGGDCGGVDHHTWSQLTTLSSLSSGSSSLGG